MAKGLNKHIHYMFSEEINLLVPQYIVGNKGDGTRYRKVFMNYLSLPPTRQDLTQDQKPKGRLKWG